MNASPVSESRHLSGYDMERTAGKGPSGKHSYMDLMEKVRGSRDGGGERDVLEQQAVELLEKFKAQQEKNAEDEKLDALLGVKDPDEGFWEARARREKEFQALRAEHARKERILERLRSGEPVSAAELFLM